jgi:GR25 family glycosyltransferase involved in LPS biosynthesis
LKKEDMTNSIASEILIQIINLKRRPDRLARISTQLEKAGLNFEVQVAVDGQLETYEPKFLSKGAIGCWKSHVNSMQRIVEANAPFGLILEDDAVLSPIVNYRFLSDMTDLMKRNQIDILQIGFINRLSSKSWDSLLPGLLEFLIDFLKRRGERDSSGVRFVPGEFRDSAHAYIVNSCLAEAISEITPGHTLIPWDDYLGLLAKNQMYRDIKIARLVKSVVRHNT